jgi:hypothetical protein
MRDFKTWLLAQQGKCGAIGDLAEAIADDDCARGCNTAAEVYMHICLDHRPSTGCLRAMFWALLDFRRALFLSRPGTPATAGRRAGPMATANTGRGVSKDTVHR